MKKQNTVYLYADGRTESFDAQFGFRPLEVELKQTFKEACQKQTAPWLIPITLLFVEDGVVLGFIFYAAGVDRVITIP